MNTFQQTESARDFAYVTHAARDMAEIMQRTFKVRIKSSSDLSFSAFFKKETALNIGKWIDVKIDWELTDEYSLFLVAGCGDDMFGICLNEDQFHHMTQVGDFPKIAELYKLYKKTLTK